MADTLEKPSNADKHKKRCSIESGDKLERRVSEAHSTSRARRGLFEISQ